MFMFVRRGVLSSRAKRGICSRWRRNRFLVAALLGMTRLSLLLLHFGQLGAEKLHRGADHGVGFDTCGGSLAREGFARNFPRRLAEIPVGRRTRFENDFQGPTEGLAGDLR